ncbi:bifunctional oligoribonuclease/PAP phosphatase NrnA [Paenibacillus macerans]|uniref:Bifunctional oligoribonuclease/PAP phosphatase NrnA n=1 Tax=Paenibacillus macerans TaxID=44252 RepID=A0A6N8EP74_PAEMA|nr:bifunctional oligoribonuclease/PAP phosphatase NrnA [Paenibacillus macerans]MBS5909866.1 bifunctional oligoribonuclease/PAP phosphatase NrnA [Paenibacillus macerans]MEC0135999.1 bifunctional oligoribonuclease/PAP phosphatase NrnA [Paenibacillus macerans]MEC0331070.1 bifunctional oligoribonuclease/PAP phosphatase NrnA [Paenibacillus macerans]MUG21759.1 bifunctional oligoribonuclease/PAP phosphatase NrnA [Paenibacillus macerans]UMV46380.1 bifunctional oligoribonuclease/PAP phosphatase NrnA [P
MQYERELRQSQAFLTEHDDFLVVAHVQPDGDAVSSTLAVGWLLSCLGKKYVMVNEGPIPKRMGYLWQADQIRDLSAEPLNRKFDNVICVDCADFKRVGMTKELFAEGAKLLNIDHHPTNDGYGTVNLIVPYAAATAEILFDLIQFMGLELNEAIATALYTGLLTDTGGFRYSNTSPKVMATASKLLEYGVEGPGLSELLLEQMTLPQLRLLTRALNGLQLTEDGKISWVVVTDEDLKSAGAVHEDMEGIVNYPRNIQGVEVGLLFKVIDEQAVKVSMRSAGKVDVAKVAQSFGGGGHVRAAGARVEGTLEAIVPRVVEQVRLQL